MSEDTPQQAAFRTAASVLIERAMLAQQAGMSFGDERDLYRVLGYPRSITTREYRDRYLRGGIAARIVEAFPVATWGGQFKIIEDEKPKNDTPFEAAWKEIAKRFRINSVLQRADILAGLSTYSVILIGSVGELNTELPRATGPENLLYLTPFTGGGGVTLSGITTVSDVDATILTYDTKTESPRFGLPQTYGLRRLNINDPKFQTPVHWSRIIHLAEGTLDDEIFGQPTLQNVWNLLNDLEKVTGGGAEAFWLRANQGLHLDIDKDMGSVGSKSSALSPDEIKKLQEQIDEFSNKMRRVIRTRGVKVETLGSDVADFASSADTLIIQIAGTKSIPKRILTGSEMGSLASEQDRANWRDQVKSRQLQHAEPVFLRPLVDRLLKYNYLPPPTNPYIIDWPQIEVLDETQKSAGALSWANTNKAEGIPTFTPDEIREYWYGKEPLTPEEIEAATPAPPPNLQQKQQVDQLAAALEHGQSLHLTVTR